MLTCLRIRDLAIIEEVELELGPGLNVITGETGAGKSILLAALKLVLGMRAGADLVRNGRDAAVVEAVFDLTRSPEWRARVADIVGTAEDELIVRRVLRAGGRSRAYVNGHLATVSQLAALTTGLVDICSQHEHHSLVDHGSHLGYLDAFAELGEERGRMRAAWQTYREAASALDAIVARARERVEREALLRLQLSDIEALAPRVGELEELELEHDRLAHADQLASSTGHAAGRLYSDDGSLAGELSRLCANLEGIRGVDAELDPLLDRLSAAAADLEDVGRDLSDYSHSIVHDPARLVAVEERLAALERLARKHGTLDAAIAHGEQCSAELASLQDIEHDLEALQRTRDDAAAEAIGVARVLSAARQEAASMLGARITEELHALGMGNARVEVDMALEPAADAHLAADGARVGESGLDRVELLIAPNPGESPKPLRKIASGGELSRSLLAIKRVLAARGPRGVYVFDEVDSGVGGAIAEVIGRKLSDVSSDHQVLCITHQPQIAAYGAKHFHVSKQVVEGRTRSVATELDLAARTEELARMLGGIELTATTRAAAAELLRSAWPAERAA
jgi:DNA repair protein RecN (Recombination protein N)